SMSLNVNVRPWTINGFGSDNDLQLDSGMGMAISRQRTIIEPRRTSMITFCVPRSYRGLHTYGAVRRRAVALVLFMVLEGSQNVPALATSPKTLGPVAAEVKVKKLGVGEHVMVKIVGGKKLHGHITEISERSFALQPDHENSVRQIAYDQILEVRKNPGPITWMLIGAAIVIIVIVATR